MKLVGLDVGEKRIGIAKADSSVKIAIPCGAIEVDGTEFKQINAFARAYGATGFVIGLPRNSKGEETAQSLYVRKFVRRLKQFIPEAKVCLQDESLTSVVAEERLKKRKKRYEKGEIDAEAASIILQDFLETRLGVNDAKKKSKKSKEHTIRNVILSILALALVCGVGIYVYYRVNLLPVVTHVDCRRNNGSFGRKLEECEAVAFEVKDGEGVREISENLVKAGLTRSSMVFQVQKTLFHAGKSLKTGSYQLTKTMSVDDLIERLDKGADAKVFSFTIIPGETIAETKAKLIEIGYDPTEVEGAFAKNYNHRVLEGKPEGTGLEGYLFGDTYEFYSGDSVEKIITTALDAMAEVLEKNGLVAKFQERGLTTYQGITMASIVEKEIKNPEDGPGVAGVFYNRLAQGMSLGSDATARYAVDLVDPNRQTYTDNVAVLDIDSPYNTRNRAGLPYGPICSPGEAALVSAGSPKESGYLFFLTGDDGLVYYSSTDAEHQQNIVSHCQQLCNVSL